MSKREKNLWQGIDADARNALNTRDYSGASFAQELSQRGLDGGELVAVDRNQREMHSRRAIIRLARSPNGSRALVSMQASLPLQTDPNLK